MGGPLAERLAFRLNVLAWDMSHAIWRLYGPRHGLSVAEWRTLAVVAELGQAGTREVCGVTRLHKARASRILARLTKRGLLERPAGLASDRRTAPHRLSAEGRRLHAEVSAVSHHWELALLDRLTPLEQLGLEQALGALQAALTAQAVDGVPAAEGHAPAKQQRVRAGTARTPRRPSA
jgi:DNA-binding MarR family transcriptional regulator